MSVNLHSNNNSVDYLEKTRDIIDGQKYKRITGEITEADP